jgi:hypothetical protein
VLMSFYTPQPSYSFWLSGRRVLYQTAAH